MNTRPRRFNHSNGPGRLTFVLAALSLATTAALPGGARRAQGAGAGQDSGVVVVAVGDIVCGSATPEGIPCQHARTGALVHQLDPRAILLLGDLQYETGSAEDFGAYFNPVFGGMLDRIFPTPGNHEYFTRAAAGYFDYFNGAGIDSGRAGVRGRGWYSFDLGGWHLIALNSNCDKVGGCGPRSPQARWLRDDLAAHPVACTLAFWHHARFSSGEHGNDPAMRDLWGILAEHGVDLVLSGHDHDYERFAPMDAGGRVNPTRGVRSFVVGTGGKGTGLLGRGQRGSERRDNGSLGVLRLRLQADRYEWRFVPVPGFLLTDTGSAACSPAAGDAT